MSDDLDRRLRASLSDVPLPAAPDTLHAAVDHLGIEEPGPLPTRVRRRATMTTFPVLVGALVIATAALLVRGSDPLGTSKPDATQAPSSAIVATASPAGTSGTDGPLSATDDGLTLTVALDRTEVKPGASLAIAVTIQNDRSVPVVLLDVDQCGSPGRMWASVPVPVDPSGRAWDGIAGDFKEFALTQGHGQGPDDAPATAPDRVDATVQPCRDGGSELTLAPGAKTTASLTWTAALVEGVPASPGDVAFSVSVGHDPLGGPPSPVYKELSVDGTIHIVGDTPEVVTVGQALDAMLADARFTAWLSEQPKDTWSTANVFLRNSAAAKDPAGPQWEIDLFREAGVPRNFAVGLVDPFTGELRQLTFCNTSCN